MSDMPEFTGRVIGIGDAPSRRHALAADAPYVCPTCGGQWFVLRRTEGSSIPEHGAITLNNERRVTGYAGEPTCAECGTGTWDAS